MSLNPDNADQNLTKSTNIHIMKKSPSQESQVKIDGPFNSQFSSKMLASICPDNYCKQDIL